MSQIFSQSVFVFFLFVLIHLAGLRMRPGLPLVKWAVLVWAPLLPASALFFPPPGMAATLLYLLFASAHWCLYLLAVVCARNSVTLRVMHEVDRAGRLSLPDLELRYSSEEGLAARIELMEKNGFIARDGDGNVNLLSLGRWSAKTALLVRWVFGVRSF